MYDEWQDHRDRLYYVDRQCFDLGEEKALHSLKYLYQVISE